MKYLLMFLISNSAFASGTCHVQVCNRIERFSFSIWSHMKDKWGENCMSVVIDKVDAVPGKVLDSNSRWFQGRHMNFTKKSVTRVKQVYSCE